MTLIARTCAALLLTAIPAVVAHAQGGPKSPGPQSLLNTANTWSQAQTFGSGLVINAPGTGVGAIINNNVSYAYPANSADDRSRYWSDTLAVGANSSGIHEANFFTVTLNGAYTVTGETNIVHSYFQNNNVNYTGPIENFEASSENLAYIGTWQDYINQPHNMSTGTAGAVIGYRTFLNNDNTTPGAIGSYVSFQCDPMAGAGSTPTFNYCIRNGDTTATIASLGGIVLGSLSPQSGQLLTVFGPDTSAGTYPVMIRNSANTILFDIADNGQVTVPGTIVPGNVVTSGEVSLKNLVGSGTAPTVTSCGTNSIDAHATSLSGTINITAGTPTSCTVTFASAFQIYNHCRADFETPSLSATGYSYTLSAITLAGAALSGKIDYFCDGI